MISSLPSIYSTHTHMPKNFSISKLTEPLLGLIFSFIIVFQIQPLGLVEPWSCQSLSPTSKTVKNRELLEVVWRKSRTTAAAEKDRRRNRRNRRREGGEGESFWSVGRVQSSRHWKWWDHSED